MKESTIYYSLLISWFALALAVFIALFFVVAPYGRHVRKGWGYSVGNKLGWVLMEAPAPIAFAVCALVGNTDFNAVNFVFLGLWEVHYIHRSFIYPFSLRGAARRMPLSVVAFGILFNFMNGYLNGRYIFSISGGYNLSWLGDPRFIIGVLLFITGYVINRQSDQVLRSLRKPGESGYKISSDYLGEITIWVGWAIATWSLPGLAFAFWTAANLVPRARANHAWYRQNFADYPPQRKALIPHVW
jgi:3-oxo-5-alpha-steroid 4-dehydrogenase 1